MRKKTPTKKRREKSKNSKLVEFFDINTVRKFKPPSKRKKVMNPDELNDKISKPPHDPDAEKTIVEKVMKEPFFVAKPFPTLSGTPILCDEQGIVRIEGEVTPQKLAVAAQFQDIFESATKEILDLSLYVPDPETLDFVKRADLSESQIKSIKAAPAWTIFNIKGENLMKTQDNKLENVKGYCYRLERAVLNQINLRRQEVKKLEDILDLRNEELQTASTTIQVLQRELGSYKHAHKITTDALNNSGKILLFFGDLFGTIKYAILKLISK